MSVNNLTRDEARQRAELISDVSYDVHLDLTGSGDTYPSTTTVRFRCAEPGADVFLELTAPGVSEMQLNGAAVPAEAFDGNRIQLSGLAAENELMVEAACAYMHTGVGLHRFVDPVDDRVYCFTQFETFDAHRVYPCFDQPDLKGPFTLSVLAPAEWQVVSNTTPETSPDGSAEGTTWWRFPATPPLSTYVTAIVAGPYAVVRDRHGDIELGIWCRQSMAEHLDPDEIFTVTKQGLDWFQEAYKYPYPFGKYDQVFVPEFNAGAMENAACITFLEDYIFRSKVTDAARERRAETILHEMAHMWFGDLVTMRWWDDLWLNESFATYMAVLCQADATRFTGAWTTFANNEKTWAYKQDQLPSTHPISADMVDIHAVEVNFDGITYAKGASVLKQLVAWVGQDLFLCSVQDYCRRHAFGNTELKDLLTELENCSGRDLSAWSKEWLETAGVNTLRASFDVDGSGAFTRFAVQQEAPEDWPTLRSHRVAIGLYDSVDGALRRRRRVETDVVGALTEIPELVGEAQPDLVLLNDDDLTFAKIRLDERSLGTVIDRLGALPDSLPRALCWAAAWDMTRDTEMAVRDYLTLVRRNISAETEVGVVQTLLGQCYSGLVQYSDPAHRAAALADFQAMAAEAAAQAEPGSDHQLAWVRSLATAASTEEHLATVRGLLDGSVQLPGLSVDTELRWHLLRALAARGAADEAEIEAEVRRDPTAAGRRHGAAARAARPTMEAKRQAWQCVMGDLAMPNATMRAIIGGFQHPEQGDLLAAFVDPYFEAVAEVWRTRGHEVAFNIITGLYPAHVIRQETLDRTDAYLREAGPEPSVRRLLVEGRDGVARALRAQARDAQATQPA